MHYLKFEPLDFTVEPCWDCSYRKLQFLVFERESILAITLYIFFPLIIFTMSKYLRFFGRGLKIALYLGTATVATPFIYLSYINSQIGSIDIDRQLMFKYGIYEKSMTPSQASKKQSQLIILISIIRVLTYHSYRSYCEKINKHIIDHSLKNYEERNMLKKIEDASKEGKLSAVKLVFEEILAIRRKNVENIGKYNYIVDELRQRQQVMYTRSILGLTKEKLEKLEKIHRFICEKGEQFKHTNIMQYNSQLAQQEQLFRGDHLHKILFI